METGFGYLGWTPEVLWKSTLVEFNAAVSGKNRAQGGPPEPMTKNEITALVSDKARGQTSGIGLG